MEVESGVKEGNDSEKEVSGVVEEEEGGVLSECERIEEFEDEGARSRGSVMESRKARRGFIVTQTEGIGSF